MAENDSQYAVVRRQSADEENRRLRHAVVVDGDTWGSRRRATAGNWRHRFEPTAIEARLTKLRSYAIEAVAVAHNETSTSVLCCIVDIHAAIDQVVGPPLLLVDTILSCVTADCRSDTRGTDVAKGCSLVRIGHLGERSALTVMGALRGVEIGLAAASMPHHSRGTDAAFASLRSRNAYGRLE